MGNSSSSSSSVTDMTDTRAANPAVVYPECAICLRRAPGWLYFSSKPKDSPAPRYGKAHMCRPCEELLLYWHTKKVTEETLVQSHLKDRPLQAMGNAFYLVNQRRRRKVAVRRTKRARKIMNGRPTKRIKGRCPPALRRVRMAELGFPV
jgi:hypothetical protein